MNQFRWFSVAVMLAALCASVTVRADITISPAQPTTLDSVRVTVAWDLPDTRWRPRAEVCEWVAPDTLSVTVPISHCNDACSCLHMPWQIRYERTCNFGVLPAGTYVARFTEYHPDPHLCDPRPTSTQTLEFTVNSADPTPIVRGSWGALKSFYR